MVIEAEDKRGKEISLELYTANERADLLEEVLGQRVAIVAGTRRLAEQPGGGGRRRRGG